MKKGLTTKKQRAVVVTCSVVALCVMVLLASLSIFFVFNKKKTQPKAKVNEAEWSVSTWDGTTSNAEEFKDGSFGNRGGKTFTINSAESFIYFINLVNNPQEAQKKDNFKGYTVYLNKNIDLAGYEIQPIGKEYSYVEGSSYSTFQGTFDGSFYTIFNAKIKGNGLFGYVENATIKNLGLYNPTITSIGVAGGLVGKAVNSSVENCYVRLGEINGTTVGGLVGSLSASEKGVHITNSFADTKLNGSTAYGLVGELDSSTLQLSHCYFTGAEQAYLAGANANLEAEEVLANPALEDFSTWSYSSNHTLKKDWTDYSAKEFNLSFSLPILSRFNKVFLYGACYEATAVVDGKLTNVDSLPDFFASINVDNEVEITLIAEKITVNSSLSLTAGKVSIISSVDSTLMRGSKNEGSIISSLGDISLGGENSKSITLDGNAKNVKSKKLKSGTAAFFANNNVVLNSNVTIQNNINNADGFGGGVLIVSAESAKIDAKISNCSSSTYGGGLCAVATAVELNADITNCQSKDGGGFALLNEADDVPSYFKAQTITRNTKDSLLAGNYQHNNASNKGGAGFVLLSEEAQKLMVGNQTLKATASNNSAKDGGGFYFQGKREIETTFELNFCEISFNNASNNGGGLYVYNYANLTTTYRKGFEEEPAEEPEEETDNQTVAADVSTLIIPSVAITDNTATKVGGIYGDEMYNDSYVHAYAQDNMSLESEEASQSSFSPPIMTMASDYTVSITFYYCTPTGSSTSSTNSFSWGSSPSSYKSASSITIGLVSVSRSGTTLTGYGWSSYKPTSSSSESEVERMYNNKISGNYTYYNAPRALYAVYTGTGSRTSTSGSRTIRFDPAPSASYINVTQSQRTVYTNATMVYPYSNIWSSYYGFGGTASSSSYGQIQAPSSATKDSSIDSTYSLYGWSSSKTTKSSSVDVTAGSYFTPSSTTTYYSVWKTTSVTNTKSRSVYFYSTSTQSVSQTVVYGNMTAYSDYSGNKSSATGGNIVSYNSISAPSSATRPSSLDSTYSLYGWSSSSSCNSSSVDVQAGNSFNAANSTSYYAVWKTISGSGSGTMSRYFAYDSGGHYLSKSFSYTSSGATIYASYSGTKGTASGGSSFTFSGTMPTQSDLSSSYTPSGKTLYGWSTSSSSATRQYSPGESFSITASSTTTSYIYAIWKYEYTTGGTTATEDTTYGPIYFYTTSTSSSWKSITQQGTKTYKTAKYSVVEYWNYANSTKLDSSSTKTASETSGTTTWKNITPGTPTRSGYTFEGWAESTSPSSWSSVITSSSFDPSRTIYYAIWGYTSTSGGTTTTQSTSRTIYFYPSSSSSSGNQTQTGTYPYTSATYRNYYYYGPTLSSISALNSSTLLYSSSSGSTTWSGYITTPSPSLSGYTFCGWATSSTANGNSSGLISSGSSIKPSQTSYYGTWKQTTSSAGWGSWSNYGTKTVNYDVNGGSSAISASSMTIQRRYYYSAVVSYYNYTRSSSYTTSTGGSATSTEYSGSITLPSTANRTGHTLKAWRLGSTSGTSYAPGATYSVSSSDTNSVTFFAEWQPNNYTITANPNGGTISNLNSWTASGSNATKSVAYGSQYGTLPTVSREHYTLAGWFTAAEGGAEVSSSTACSGTATIYARWTPVNYTITANPNGGTISALNSWTASGSNATKSVAYGSQYGTFPTVSKGGYTLKGWYTSASGGSSVSTSTSCSGDATIYAHWTPVNYTITANVNGGTISNLNGWTASGSNATKSVAYGSTYGTLPSVSRTHYTFDGWYTSASGGSSVSTSTSCSGDATIYAHWTPVNYTITANVNGGTISNLNGWTASGSNATKSVAYGSSYGTLPAVTRTHYTLAGWYTSADGGTKVETSTTCSGAATIYAHWTPVNYTITANVNGGTISNLNGWTASGSNATKSVAYGSQYGTLPTVTRTNYTFLGWFTAVDSGSSVTNTTTSSGDATIYAHWKLNNFTLTFNPNGGSLTGPETYEVTMGSTNYNSVSSVLPKRDKYNFKGWFTSSEGGTMVYDNLGNAVIGDYWASTTSGAVWNHEGNVTLYAQWAAATTTVNFDSNGGQISFNPNLTITYFDTKFYYNSSLVTPTATRTGYAFDGWYSALTAGVKVIDASGSLIANVSGYTDANKGWIGSAATTLYARWTANQYTVNIEFNGGVEGTKSYTLNFDQVLTLTAPTKQYSTFLGWTGSNINASTALSGSSESALSSWNGTQTTNLVFKNLASVAGTTVTLTANWQWNPYTVTTEKNEHTATLTAPQTGKFGEALAFSWAGYPSTNEYEYELVAVKVYAGTDKTGQVLLNITDKQLTSSTYTMSGTYYPNIHIYCEYARYTLRSVELDVVGQNTGLSDSFTLTVGGKQVTESGYYRDGSQVTFNLSTSKENLRLVRVYVNGALTISPKMGNFQHPFTGSEFTLNANSSIKIEFLDGFTTTAGFLRNGLNGNVTPDSDHKVTFDAAQENVYEDNSTKYFVVGSTVTMNADLSGFVGVEFFGFKYKVKGSSEEYIVPSSGSGDKIVSTDGGVGGRYTFTITDAVTEINFYITETVSVQADISQSTIKDITVREVNLGYEKSITSNEKEYKLYSGKWEVISSQELSQEVLQTIFGSSAKITTENGKWYITI